MQVRKLDTERRSDVHRFIAFPFELYHSCPQWVPPLWPEMRQVMSRKKHPFYLHSEADFFLVESAGQTMARAMVMNNRNYNDHHGKHTAFFYFFDSVNDTHVCQVLFNAIADWARSRDLEEIVGPKGILPGGDGLGVLVEGFDQLPALTIPYNFDYYDALLQHAGFTKETDYLSGYLPGDHKLPQRFFDIADKVKERRGFSIKTFKSKREALSAFRDIGSLYNQAFVDNWEYCPITKEELNVLAEHLKAIVDLKLAKLVMKDGKMVGFVLAYPDISLAIQKTRGRIWPFGWIPLLREFKRTEVGNVNGVGLLPEYRGVGANALLYTEVAKSIHDFGWERAEIVQVEEGNTKSLQDMSAIGVIWHKRHRVYHRCVD
jgi:hypothetical protein